MTDDASLMQRVAARDAVAFAQLYDRFGGLVYGVARRVLDDAAQAEDIVQSVFTQVWERPAMFAGGSFGAWVARVARNAALDVRKSAYVRTREPEPPPDVAAAVAAEDEALASLRRAEIARALSTLPPEQREAIEQAYLLGHTYDQVAARTGTPLGTIKSRIRAGLRRLHDALHGTATA